MELMTRALAPLALTLTLALTLLAAPLGAHAQRRGDPRERQARALFEQGEAAYEEGRYEEAVAAFEQAYGLSARPLLLYNIANAKERLGLLSEALENLRYYLEDAPDDERPVIERRIRGLEDRVARQQREESERRADQERIAQSAAEAAAAATMRNERGHAAPDGPAPPVLGWTLTLGGGALAVAGVVFGVMALGARSDAAALCHDVGDSTFCPTSADSALSSDTLFSLLADLGVLVGAATTALGVYLVLTHDSDSPPPGRAPAQVAARLELGVRSLAGGALLSLRGTL